MRFQAQVNVVGIKRSKGEMEGVKYDSTKFYIETDLDDRTGNAKGKATVEYSMGTSDVYAQYEKLPFPFVAQGSFAQVTTGKVMKVVLEELKPLRSAPAQG